MNILFQIPFRLLKDQVPTQTAVLISVHPWRNSDLTPFKDSDFTPLKSFPLPNAKPEETSSKPNQKTFYKTHDFESSQGSRLWMADWSMVYELGMLTKGAGHPGFPTFFLFLLYSITGKIWITSRRRSPVGCNPWGRKESDMTEQLHFHFSLSYIGEGNGNLLQCSCLENPRDGGPWWATVYGVTQSRTRLKWLSSGSKASIIYTLLCNIYYSVQITRTMLRINIYSKKSSYIWT